VMRAKPSSAKGAFIKSISISATMSPGIKIALSELANTGK